MKSLQATEVELRVKLEQLISAQAEKRCSDFSSFHTLNTHCISDWEHICIHTLRKHRSCKTYLGTGET